MNERIHLRRVWYAIVFICAGLGFAIWVSTRISNKPPQNPGFAKDIPEGKETNSKTQDRSTFDTPRTETRGSSKLVGSPAMSEIPKPGVMAAADFVKKTLANPSKPTKPSDIPRLTDDQVDQLAIGYVKLAKPSEKFGILWALGFSQNDRAFDTLRYAMTEEYSRTVLSRKDNSTQLSVVRLLGVLSRSSDRAWQFLLGLTYPKAWEGIDFWSEDYLTDQYKSEERSIAQVRSALQGGVLAALGASDRPEFKVWADSLLNGSTPLDTFYQRQASSIAYGVFQAHYIDEHGRSEFYDNVLFHFSTKGVNAYSQWSQTAEGKRWIAWWQDQVTQAARQDAANLEK